MSGAEFLQAENKKKLMSCDLQCLGPHQALWLDK